MIIGVPKEIMHDENRGSATPEVCARYISMGHTVLVEHDAGEGAFFHDEQYQAAGAELVMGPKEIYDRADVILKVKEPLFNENLAIHEVDMMRPGQTLITFIHPAAPANHQMVKGCRGFPGPRACTPSPACPPAPATRASSWAATCCRALCPRSSPPWG